MSLLIRDYTDADRSYVISTWLSNYGPHAKENLTPREWSTFRTDHDAKIKTALLSGMRVLIAYDDEHPIVIIGWIAFGPEPVLHYVYVRNQMRRQGVARALLTSRESLEYRPFMYVSHRTPCLPFLFGEYDAFPSEFPPMRPTE